MAGFEEQLNNILGNQEAMNQIMALARSLSGDQPEAPALEEPQDTYQAPEAPLPDLSELLGQVDPSMIQTGMEVLRQIQGTEDRSAALLNALRPFLREERRARLDRALQIVRITKVVRVVLGTLGGKEGSVYNRYIPEDASYTRIQEERPPERPKEAGKGPSIRFPDFLSGKEGLAALFKGGEGGGLSGLLKTLRLDSLDAGDILLLLIILYLLVEGDDLDLVIALGAVLLMGLGES